MNPGYGAARYSAMRAATAGARCISSRCPAPGAIPSSAWGRRAARILFGRDGAVIAAISAAVEAPEADRLDQLGDELKRAVAELTR